MESKRTSLRLTGRPFIRLASYVAAACMVSFSACDKVKDATSTDVKVDKATIELTDIAVQEPTRADALNPFGATQTIFLSQIEGFTEDLMQYQSKITDINVDAMTITILASDDEDGTVVEDFNLSADGVGSELSIPEYSLGTAYAVAGAQPFATALMLELFKVSSITMHVEGKTDVTSGKNLQVKIEMEDLVFTVGVLN